MEKYSSLNKLCSVTAFAYRFNSDLEVIWKILQRINIKAY